MWMIDQTTTSAEKISRYPNVDEFEKEFKELIELVSLSWKAVRNMFNNTQIILDERLTLTEFKNTATNVIIQASNAYLTGDVFLKEVKDMVNIVLEIEQIRNYEPEDQLFTTKKHVQNQSMKELLYTCLSSYKQSDNEKHLDYYSERNLQNEIDKIVYSSDIMVFKINK